MQTAYLSLTFFAVSEFAARAAWRSTSQSLPACLRSIALAGSEHARAHIDRAAASSQSVE